MRLQSIVLILIVLLASTTTKQAKPINITDPYVIGVAKFAVDEYNHRIRIPEHKLRLEEVIKGESQDVIDGVNYNLTLSATDFFTSKSNKYEAVVLEVPVHHLRNLTSFKRINA